MSNISDADHDIWHHFLEAVAPVIVEHLGANANIVIGAQFGSMIDAPANDGYDACAVATNMAADETELALREMSAIGAKVAEHPRVLDDVLELALLALASGDDEAIHVAAEQIAEIDPEGWARAGQLAELLMAGATEEASVEH